MRYNPNVKGSQSHIPDDIEVNGNNVYARANIVRIEEPERDGIPGFKGWQYEEVILSRTEFDRLRALDSSWIREWSAAVRTAERRARYERIDPKVSSLRRKIDLGIDVDESTEKLMTLQRYCREVNRTKDQPCYPNVVEYPEEPTI